MSIDDYPDGAWLCELGVANDDDEVVQIVATSLGVTPRPGMSLEASVLEYLRTKQLLLVLDNCEHVLNVTGRLAEAVVRGCPDVHILATSREGLAVEGEQIRPLRSLSLPEPSAPWMSSPRATRSRSSSTVLVRRGRASRLDATNASAIAEICRRLDGIPLAIELAAARVVSMSPNEIVALLDERFRLLTGGRRTAVERHQTLRAAVDWSYSLLTEAEQLVFARLSVFSGSFAATDATAVVTGDGIDTWDVIDLIGSLVAKSMLIADEAADGATRYRELETLRQYARERLDDSDDPDVWRRRHAEHFAEFAEQAGAGLLGADELAWRPRAMAELDNLRSAVAWSLDREDPDDNELAVRIVAALSNEANSGRALEVGAWAERALPLVERTTAERRAAVLSAASWNAILGGDLELARDRSDAVLREEDVLGFADALRTSSSRTWSRSTGDYDRVLATLDEGLAAPTPRPDLGDAALTRALLVIGQLGMELVGGHSPESAQADASEAVRAAQESGHPTAMANALFVSGLEVAHPSHR